MSHLKKNPSTLKSLCISAVANLISTDFKFNDENAKQLAQYFFMPRCLTTRLMSLLKARTVLHLRSMIILLKLGLPCLNLSYERVDLVHWLLKRARTDMKGLKTLEIVGIHGLRSLNFLPFLISSIQKLNLSRSTVSDIVLLHIALSCPQLEFLNLNYCNIGDIGIIFFCSSYRRCFRLKCLHILHTKVSAVGILLLLQTFSELEEIESNDFVHVMLLLEKLLNITRNNNNTIIPLKLKTFIYKIHNSSPSIPSEQIYRAYTFIEKVCPLINRAVIGIYHPCVHHILPRFKYLQKLEFDFGSSFSFNKLKMLLKTLGSQLKKINLHNIRNIQLSILFRFCPVLEELKLQSSPNCFYSGTVAFPSLKKLIIEGYLNFITLKNILKSCPFITDLNFQLYSSMTDEKLKTLINLNLLPNLKSITFLKCSRLSTYGLRHLLYKHKSIADINVLSCSCIFKIKFKYFMKWAEKFRPDVNWYYENVHYHIS